MSFFIFHLFFFESRSNLVFSMINETTWIVSFCANWLNCCKIFKTMRNSIEKFTKLIFLWTISSIVFFKTEFFYFFDNEMKRFLEFLVLFFDHERSWFEFCLKSFRLYRRHKFFCRQDSCSDDKINVRVRNNALWFFVANEIVLNVYFIRCFWFWRKLMIILHWWQN
jgi:hypothetical protein